MKKIKQYTNIKWLPDNSTMDIILTDNIIESFGKSTSVFSFIINKKSNTIILLKHADKTRGYDIPGGHVEEGESIVEALHREVMEETGAIIKNERMIGIQLIAKDKPEKLYPDLISHQVFFVAELDSLTNNELEVDSLGIIEIDIQQYHNTINSNSNIYLKELFDCLELI